MDISTIMEDISETDLKEHRMTYKKSILNQRSPSERADSRRDNSKIQWMEVPEKMVEDRKFVKSSIPVLGILASRGYRWHYIHDAMLRLRWEEIKQEETPVSYNRVFNSLIQDLGSGVLQKRYNKNADLSLDQQSQLVVLKLQVKTGNDAYLKSHPEIGIMMKLVYAALFKHRPPSPKEFLSNYVHHLNKHREELVVKVVDIPFDPPPVPVPDDIPSEEEDRRLIREFAQQIVEHCLNLVTLGESYIDVMSILNTVLNKITHSDSETSIESAISDAETAVSDILRWLLRSVALKKSTSAEQVVDELLNTILSNSPSYVPRDSKVYSEMKNSVENFIRNLLENLTDTAVNNRSLLENVKNQEMRVRENIADDGTGKSILRKDFQDEELKSRTKVKFQSLSESYA